MNTEVWEIETEEAFKESEIGMSYDDLNDDYIDMLYEENRYYNPRFEV